MSTTDFAALSGLEFMRWVQTERPADAPFIGRLLGMRFDEVDRGRVVISLYTRPDFANPLGTVHGGIAAPPSSTPSWAARSTPRSQLASATPPSNSR